MAPVFSKEKKAMYKEIIPSNCTYHEIINWSKPRSNYLNTLFLLGFKVGHPWFTHGQVHLFWPNLQYIMELRHYLNWQRTIWLKRSESSIDVVNSSSLESKCRFFSSVQEYFEIKEDIKNILTRVKFIVKTV